MKNNLLLPTFFLCVLWLVGCSAGNGENLDQNGQPLIAANEDASGDDSQNNEEVNEQANLVWIQDNVFSAICSACHAGANPAAGQNLSTMENSVQYLIGVQSSNPEFVRVKPGEPEQSYLILKITGDPRAGAQMPLGMSPLPTETIEAIREWIQLGALVPDVASIPTRVNRTQVTAVTNAEHEEKLTFTISFNREMDFATFNVSDVLVKASYSETSKFIEPEQIQLGILSKSSIAVSLNAISQDTQTITLSINNPAISSVTSSNGQLLDGDFDDKDGGEFVYVYQL